MRDYHILIADDEPIECIALELLLKNNFPELLVLPSVSNGIDFVASAQANNPDIVIVDINMPGLSGLDALDMIRNRHPEMKIIIHSAYSEFAYARKAVSLNAFDYMVKPVQKPVFIETMRRLLETLGKERQKRSSEETIHRLTGEVNRLVESDIMSSILLGVIDKKTSELFLKSLGQEYQGGFLVTARQPGSAMAAWNPRIKEEMLSALNQVCLCLGKSYYQDVLLYLIPGPGVGEGNYRQWSRHLLESLNLPLLFGVSTWKFAVDELPDAQKESSSVLLGKQKPEICFFEYASPRQVHNVFQEKKKYLADLIAAGNIEECCRTVDGLCRAAASEKIPLTSMEIYGAYFLLYLHSEMASRFSFPLYDSGYMPGEWRELWNCADYGELSEKLQGAVNRLSRLLLHPMNKSWEYVSKAFICVKKMYGRDISLEDIASMVGISPFYLSRLLKQELNETFVELLTKVRIARALALLPDSKKTIREIGEEVGYSNTTYFYKVFKKQTGMTIGEVRQYL